MIIPFFNDFLQWTRVPVTIGIFALNLIVYIVVTPAYVNSQTQIEDIVNNDRFLKTQGQLFAQMITKSKKHYDSALVSLSERVNDRNSDSAEILGRLAMRNSEFMEHAQKFPYRGDHISYASWKKQFKIFADLRDVHPNYTLGYSSVDKSWQTALTYQFVHGGLSHLMINMLVLFLLGSYLEPTLGGPFFLICYILSGMGAAFGFDLVSGATPVPLVGASGAIMGLLGALSVATWGKKLRFVWLLPTRAFTGFVWLPSWIFVAYLMATDVAGLIETSSWLGAGVAHAAHIGGFLTGTLIALLSRFAWNSKHQPARVLNRELHLDSLIQPR